MSLFSLYFYALFAFVLFGLLLLSKFAPSKLHLQRWFLLLASLAFIAFASWKSAVVILLVSAVTWFCGSRKSRHFQYAGIVILVFVLCFYKYADARTLSVIVPIGVSFFTFNAISYLADVAKGEAVRADFVHVALYLSFFPRLASGPLQKASDFFSQIDENRVITKEKLSAGMQIYFWGLFKKLVLADRLSVFVNEVYATPAAFSGLSMLLALVSYSLQIYFDFSGYSDMAIGVGKCLGFELPVNFSMPYLSQNVTEFWRRWHISLSTWIRNYIYIPLGGNRKGKVRQGTNLLVAMTLCGLWHGASWNFVLWGFLHGVALLAHKRFSSWRKKRGRDGSSMGKVISVLLTFAFVSLLWVLFRAENLQEAIAIYQRLFMLSAGLHQPYLWSFIAIAVFVITSVIVIIRNEGKAFYPILDLSRFTHLTAFFVFLGLLFGLCYTGGSPFIYGAF